jgi:hypothetical protein
MSMDSAKMGHVFASQDGMESTALLRAVLKGKEYDFARFHVIYCYFRFEAARITVNVVLVAKAFLNADVTTDGTVSIARSLWKRIARTQKTMIMVRRH